MKRALSLVFLLALLAIAALAKETPFTLVWPSEQQPAIRFSFGKFVKLGSMASENSYAVDVTATNLWKKAIPDASFDAYFFSKDNVRVGTGLISLSNMGVGETVKFTMPFGVTGAQPVTLKIVAIQVPKELGPTVPARKIRTTVYSVPAGARLRVDGEEAGTTPKQVELAVGKHTLQFSLEGYHIGTFALEVGPDDVSGGTVSFELGALAHDTVELWDGTTLTGDVESMSATDVVVRVGGNLQSLDRNRVKRILLIQRESPTPQN